ncbi:lipoprotein-releasing ABC transporter permease subunit LolE [Vibrio algarum]|uniref:Lipoprotein-releasing ABC transporter permease subunit LolE n=1 Tax=Vibrio algarum TaxID=3020714 RepID=A0ABT4YR60_9VIBR|nr:lipoprotein-releasing ABC transporter permease subunit LolE [Vibrio sp. KJ40-1]MDB1123568.1 lipoprotein-releasing ABC transporter permease subunit LolE [Vibrio sp. KJ40-1]
MFGSLSFFIGRRFSGGKQRNKMVSFISVSSTIGIAVGVAVIIIGLSAMNGFERELKNRVLSVVAHGEFEGVKGEILEWQKVIEQANSHEKVSAAAPYVRFTALAERAQNIKAIEVRGVDPDLESEVSNLTDFIPNSVWTKFRAGESQVVLGKGIADNLGLKQGDSLTLLIPVINSSINKVQAPRRVRVKVAGLLTLGGQIDHALALIPLKDAQEYARLGDAVTGVSIRTTDVFNAPLYVRQIGNQLESYVYLKSWKQKYGFLYRDIQLVRTIMYLVMVLVIGVACFNIVSTLMMAVKDRASEIAILRTMGASDGLVRRIFIWLGVLSGVLGSLVGSVIGVLVALNLTYLIKGVETLLGQQFLSGDIYFVDFLPSQVESTDVLIVSGTAIVLSLLATWYPAKKASQMNPARVLSAK